MSSLDRHPEELPGHVPEKLHLSTGLGPPWNPLIAAGGKKSGHLCLIFSEKFAISTSSFLFICLSFVGSVLGSSRGFQIKKVCYGDSVNIELKSYYKGSLYFYPIAGGARKLLMDNREAKDPRLKVFSDSVTLTQLTERDNGDFVLLSSTGQNLNYLSLTINDCSKYVELFYGQEMMHIVPSNADLLEFTPLHRLDQPQLLWERTNPFRNYGGRRRVSGGLFRIYKITQEDNGYYNFRKKDKSVVSRIHLNVQEKTSYYNAKENEKIILPFPWENGNWTVTFKQKNEEGISIMKSGRVDISVYRLSRKLSFKSYGIEMCCLRLNDAGTFEFRDSAGNLALVSHVIITVKIPELPQSNAYIIVAVVAGVLGYLCFCCCCCKKFCCSNEKPPSEVAQTAEEPKVFYHDLNEPEGSGFSAAPYSAAFPPPAGNVPFPPPAMNAGISHDAAAASSGPVVCHHGNTNISQPEVAPQASDQSAPSSSGYNPLPSHSQPMFETYQPTYEIKNISQPGVAPGASEQSAPSSSSGYNPVSSDYQPMFEVKGLNSTFDLPLSAENSSTDVYNSDKMNFL
ncbi:hypothetical protein FQA47_013563 [Oryzias melastigma]|uniref:Uncharacterized protein n=1 Tax=Oryzias melastigma TaxID=30732 RepID=A0A834EYY4_ORYME|nr:hypothetical protein FQA47_013563 [Oryzias melastigma]